MRKGECIKEEGFPMDDRDKQDSILSAIADAESRLVRLDRDRQKIIAELKSLNAELLKLTNFPLNITNDKPDSSGGSISKTSSPDEKVALFRKLRNAGQSRKILPQYLMEKSVSFLPLADMQAKDLMMLGLIPFFLPCRFHGRAHLSNTLSAFIVYMTEKKEVRIYDYVDGNISMLMNMFKKRLRGYRALGYEISEEKIG